MYYLALEDLVGLEAFLSEALSITEPPLQSSFYQRFDGIA